MRSIQLVLAGLLSAASLSVSAQSAPASLQTVARTALLNHPSVIGARARQDVANYSLDAAKGGRFPSLAVGLGNADDGSRLSTLSLTQPLWTGGRITGEITAGQARVSAAEAGLREAEQQLAEQVVQIAMELARFRTLVAIAVENIAAHERLLGTTERRTQSGASAEADLVLARSRMEQARAMLTQWQAAEQRAAARLASVTGEAAPTQIAVGSGLLPTTAKAPDVIETAYAFSPTLARLRAEADAAGGDAMAAESRLYPQISIKAENIDNTRVFAQNDSRVMLMLEYQPGAGLSARDKARAAVAQQRVTEITIDRAKREIAERVSADMVEAQSLLPRIEALERSVKASEELVASYVRQFTAGKRNWLDVLNIQNEYTNGRQALEDTRFAALSASYRVALATGKFFGGSQ